MQLVRSPESVEEKWLNSPIRRFRGNLADIDQHIPEFERREFKLPEAAGESRRANERLDAIVRKPFGDDKAFVAIGTVSKDYTLVPHGAVLDAARKALTAAGVKTDDTGAALEI
jgi:hypothetical protein